MLRGGGICDHRRDGWGEAAATMWSTPSHSFRFFLPETLYGKKAVPPDTEELMVLEDKCDPVAHRGPCCWCGRCHFFLPPPVRFAPPAGACSSSAGIVLTL